MVGDGVNDVLALKDANCGIAMAAGSDAAKQVAHIVLMDSNFASMKSIVREGRMIISNIERVSALYLTKTIYSVSWAYLSLCTDSSEYYQHDGYRYSKFYSDAGTDRDGDKQWLYA